MESCNTESSLDLPLESLSLQPFLQSLHKEQWQEVRLGEVAEIFDYQRIPLSTMQRINRKGAYPYYGASGVIDYIDDFIFDGEFVLISEDGENLRTRKTPIAFKVSGKFWVNNHAHIVKGKKDYFNDLIVYLFENLDLNPYITGAVQPKLNQSTLLNIPFKIPILETTQQKIAEILSSFDDKIDLLHRQNKTLESLVLTLFRHYSTHKELDSIIGDIIALQSGYAFKSKDFQNFGKDRILKIKNIQNSVIDIINTDFVNENISKILDSKFRIFGGDILFGMTGAEIGKMGIVPKNNETLWLNQRVGVLREKFKGAKYLAYLHLTSAFGFDYIVNAASGSAQPNISAKDIENCPFYYFTESELHNMSLQISPFFEKMIQNSGTILTLQAMRDMLLKAIFA